MTPVLERSARGRLGVAGHRRTVVDATRWATTAALTLFVFTIPTASMVMVSAGAGTLSRLVGVAALPLAAVALALGGRRRRLLDVHVLLVTFAVWVAASSLWTRDLAATTERATTTIQLVVVVLLIWEFCGDRDRWRALLWAYLLGCAVVSVQVVQALASDAELFRGRYSAAGFNPNDLVQILLVAIPIAAYLAVTASTRTRRVGAAALVPLASLAIVLTGSRQGILLLPVALAAVPVTMTRLSPRARATAVLGLLLVTAVLAPTVPTDTVERLRSVPEQVGSGDLGGRGELWSSAGDAIVESPVIGVGAGSLEGVIADDVGYVAGAHNTYLSIAGELGVIGIGLFLLALLGTVLHTRRYPATERLLGMTLGVVLVLSLIPGHNEHAKATWFAIAVLLAPAAGEWTTWTVRERLRRGLRPVPQVAAAPVAAIVQEEPT